MTELIDAVYFDFQGTLVDVSGIRHLVEGEKRNFDAFHWATANCLPIQWVMAAARKAHADGLVVLLGTGMNEKYRRMPSWWLASHEVHVDDLQMRPDGNFEKDYLLKRKMRDRWKQVYNIVHAWDDNPAVIEHVWAEDGIPYTQVPGWKEG